MKKKGIILTILLLLLLTLTGCKVNWFTKTYDVPWYVIAVTLVPVIVVVFIFSYFFIIKATYVCPNCHMEFKPKWYHFYTCIHLNKKRMAKCPHCGRKGFCEVKGKSRYK